MDFVICEYNIKELTKPLLIPNKMKVFNLIEDDFR